jgi:hypothetical protein
MQDEDVVGVAREGFDAVYTVGYAQEQLHVLRREVAGHAGVAVLASVNHTTTHATACEG